MIGSYLRRIVMSQYTAFVFRICVGCFFDVVFQENRITESLHVTGK